MASRDGSQRDRSRSNTHSMQVLAVLDFYYFTQACNLTERENLQNSDCHGPFRFLFENFRLCLRYNNVNYGDWHVYKPFFGSVVATSRLACSEISLSTNEKKLERHPGNQVGHRTIWQMA